MQIKFVLAFLCSVLAIKVFAQKEPVTPEAYNDWRILSNYGISDDGKYAWYYWRENSNMVYATTLCSTDGRFQKEFKAYEAVFLGNKLILRTSGDSLCIFDLRDRKARYLRDINQYTVFENAKGKFLLCSGKQNLSVENVNSGKIYGLPATSEYTISPDRSRLALLTGNGELNVVSLSDGKMHLVSGLPGISHVVFNHKGNGLAFFSSDKTEGISVNHYSIDSGKVTTLVNNKRLATGVEVNDQQLEFSSDDAHVYFKARQATPPVLVKDKDFMTDNLEIWNYKDLMLKGEAGGLEKRKELCTSVVSVRDQNIIQLESDSVELIGNVASNNNYVLAKTIVNEYISYWNNSQVPVYRLIDIQTGKHLFFMPKELPIAKKWFPAFSAAGRFLTWPVEGSGDIYAYETATTKTRKITGDLDHNRGGSEDWIGSILGWLPGDKSCIVSNQADIWQIDPENKMEALKLTGKLSDKTKYHFELNSWDMENDKLIFSVLDSNNNNGFAVVDACKPQNLKMGKLFPYMYYIGLPCNDPCKPLLKAKNADVYIVSRQSASEAPNLVVTTDLVSYRALSDIHPEKQYNWMKSELVRWKQYDGTIGKGILYRPENFDASKKYPVIFHYYQERNKELHKFRNIGIEGDLGNVLPIADYVGGGYVVFIPDILNDKPGKIARSTVNAVESAAKYLVKTFPWIDEKRMGLQGHSFGGYETNILIAHSSLFAAASSANSIADLVSYRGLGSFGHITNDELVELGQTNMGKNVSPWNSTTKYIDNSPLFFADKVATPLLLKSSDNDFNTHFSQSLEFFTALRRAGKAVWLLNYKGGDHVLSGPGAYDFNIRQRQFFDHYLMGKPAPIWMTRSIPEKEQLYRSGLQIYQNGYKP